MNKLTKVTQLKLNEDANVYIAGSDVLGPNSTTCLNTFSLEYFSLSIKVTAIRYIQIVHFYLMTILLIFFILCLPILVNHQIHYIHTS